MLTILSLIGNLLKASQLMEYKSSLLAMSLKALLLDVQPL